MISPDEAAATVVVFGSAICPISDKYVERLNGIYSFYAPKGVQFIFADPNRNEKWADLERYAKNNGVLFPVYMDTENRLADILGAQSTPEAFLLDSRGMVQYRGAIDDAANPARVRSHFLRSAIDALIERRPVAQSRTRAFGCAIHRTGQP